MKTLKGKLLTLLLPALIVLMCGELWLSSRELRVAANSAYDRSLAGAIKAIDAGISTASGGLGMELPYAMLEFFELTASGKVFYRVTTEDGLVSLGTADLPESPIPLQSGRPHFYDAQYLGEPVRVGAYARGIAEPLYGAHAQRIVILVAESVDSRSTFARDLLLQGAAIAALLVLVIAVLMTLAIVLALRPILRLRNEVLARAPDDLTPVDAARVPLEIRPLVDAINHHVERSLDSARGQRQFLDDASHQLRTPLSVLQTQLDYALRAPDIGQVREALRAMQKGLWRAARGVNQLLAMARVNNVVALRESMRVINLGDLTEEVARALLPAARRKRQDFGFLRPPGDIFISGLGTLIREAIFNLLDNAIQYTPDGGQVTLSIEARDGCAMVTCADNGPGIPAAERAHIGERFRRGKDAPAGGAGLGLAIAKTIIELHHGQLQAADGPHHTGIAMRAMLPLHRDGR